MKKNLQAFILVLSFFMFSCTKENIQPLEKKSVLLEAANLKSDNNGASYTSLNGKTSIITGTSDCPLSYCFKRNNGNGWGVCHADAQIRVSFSQLPASNNIPVLTAIYYKDQLLTNVKLPVYGDIIDKTKPYISYCLTGSLPETNNGNPAGNIPPAVKLRLQFTYLNGTTCSTDNQLPPD